MRSQICACECEQCPGAVRGDINKVYFLYQICILLSLLIFLCSCRIPYSRASAVGGQPGKKRKRKKGRKSHRAGTCTKPRIYPKADSPLALWQECKETKLMAFIKKSFIKHSNSLFSKCIQTHLPPH